MNAKIVRQRNDKGRFLKNGEVNPRILANIERGQKVRDLAREARIPEYERDLTHNPFAGLLKR